MIVNAVPVTEHEPLPRYGANAASSNATVRGNGAHEQRAMAPARKTAAWSAWRFRKMVM
jgi:hypothetical protein